MRSIRKFGAMFFCLCLLVLPAWGQWGPYHFQRQLSGIESTWHTLELPNELFHRIKINYADLRIMGITPKGDTIEAPYIIDLPEARPPVEKMAFTVINRSRRDGKFFATLESPTAPKVNRIQLNIGQQNFDWRVLLEGSNDQQEWFTLLQDYRILAIDNSINTYAFTTLHFPEAQYRYYRISIPTEVAVALNAATSSRQSEQQTLYRSYPIVHQDIQENNEEKRTEIALTLAWPVPLSYLSLEIRDSIDYYRPISIQLLTDSTRTEAGMQYSFSEVHSDVLSSLEPRVFTFPPTRARSLHIFLQNHDNAPLHISDLQVEGQVPVIRARFTEKAEYYLLYGWEDARPPRYDLANFADKIPEALQALIIGPEIRLQPDTVASGPIFANRAWLWGIMLAVIVLLGWFSIRMLSTSQA